MALNSGDNTIFKINVTISITFSQISANNIYLHPKINISKKIMIPIGGHTPTIIASIAHIHQSEEDPDVVPLFARW